MEWKEKATTGESRGRWWWINGALVKNGCGYVSTRWRERERWEIEERMGKKEEMGK